MGYLFVTVTKYLTKQLNFDLVLTHSLRMQSSKVGVIGSGAGRTGRVMSIVRKLREINAGALFVFWFSSGPRVQSIEGAPLRRLGLSVSTQSMNSIADMAGGLFPR